MCGCIVEIAMLVMGIVALVKGRIPLTRTRVVEGTAARVVGLILMLPLPLALGFGFIYGVGIGVSAAQQGKSQIDPKEIEKIQTTAKFVELGLIVGCALTAVVVGAVTARPPKLKEDIDLDEEASARWDRRRPAPDEDEEGVRRHEREKEEGYRPDNPQGR
ncbi:MAG TPA: hypothetical protein VFA26_03075 [Gemmataceae bacterium]|nr:hypothetical protein [Gemmataceae bacterium]